MGHVYGHEFWYEREKAEKEGLTQAQFNDRMNNSQLYQLEDGPSNMGHSHEKTRAQHEAEDMQQAASEQQGQQAGEEGGEEGGESQGQSM